jgi:hypothetical protein
MDSTVMLCSRIATATSTPGPDVGRCALAMAKLSGRSPRINPDTTDSDAVPRTAVHARSSTDAINGCAVEGRALRAGAAPIVPAGIPGPDR